MRNLLFVFLLSATVSFAQMVNGIALVVNDDPITLYDIEKRAVEKGISRDKAVSELVDETMFEQQIAKYNITADIFDVNNYLEKIAKSNGMDLYTFKSIIKQKYKDYSRYEEQTKENIKRQKLTDRIVRGNLKIATEEDLKIYYENNPNMFQMASKVRVIQYASTSKADLNNAINNPMANVEGITRAPLELDQNSINPQLRYILNETKVNQFTPIFTSNKQFVSLLVKEKLGSKTLNFADVKDRIFNIIMQDREKKYLKDYFEKLKLSADIKIVR